MSFIELCWRISGHRPIAVDDKMLENIGFAFIEWVLRWKRPDPDKKRQ